ncbi:MAG: GFA family protein [Pseudomonadota bacterium]
MLKGSCLCGAVTIAVAGDLEHDPQACHCRQCQKQTSSFYAGVNVRKSALTVRGEAHVRWFRSSVEVERGFCAVCGSTLFWRPDLPGYAWISIAMGLFDESTGRRMTKHEYVAERGDYYPDLSRLPDSGD